MLPQDAQTAPSLEKDESQWLKSELLTCINDEIRTPLTGAVGMAYLLLETHLDEEQKEYALSAQTCAEEALERLSMLVELSALAAGQFTLDEGDFLLPQVLKSAAALVAEEARTKGVTMSVTWSEDLPGLAVGDAVRLRRILTQLLGNAVRFTERGEIGLYAGWRPSAPGSFRLEVEVRDAGSGMWPEQLRFLFERSEAGPKRQLAGGGLSLALVRELAVAMGGQMHAQSVPGKGTVVSFWVPLRKSSVQVGSLSAA